MEIVDDPVDTPNVGEDHFAKCKLRAFGLDTEDYLPSLTRDTHMCDSTPDGGHVMYATYPSLKWNELRGLKPKHVLHILEVLDTPLSCGGSGLPLEHKINEFAANPRYIGCDTGDYHLMLAVGGKCIVLVPDDCDDYQYRRWHYDSDRVVYVNMEDYKSVDRDFVSRFFW